MPPKTTTWELEDHTLGKHRVLESYMGAWLPKIARYNRHVLFVDGFAGPGEYRNGERGSPVIALESFVKHAAFERMMDRITFVFIELDSDRAEHLKRIVEPYKNRLPDKSIRIFNSPFDEKMSYILDRYDSSHQRFPPAFVMIDPFGVKGAPMHVISRILSNSSTEVYFSFMHDVINRFRQGPELEPHLDELFGCSEWREGTDIPEGRERLRFFHDLYENCLRRAGAKYVLKFELYKKERPFYTLFFATQHLEGCDAMKTSMWKTAPFGDFKFKSRMAHQLTLGTESPDFIPLREALQREFGHQDWVTIEKVIDYVKGDQTDYYSGQLKLKTLRPMESDCELEADTSNPNRRKGTFPPRTRIRFLGS